MYGHFGTGGCVSSAMERNRNRNDCFFHVFIRRRLCLLFHKSSSICNSGTLVCKKQSEQDKRVYFVSLTQKGKDILNGDREVYRNVTREITAFCKNEKEQKFMQDLLEMLVEKLAEKEK